MIAPAIIARREIRDTLSDWRVVTPMLVLAILFPAITVAAIRLGVPILDRIDPEATTDKIIPFGAMIAAFFPISFSLVVALESFVGEKERNTLEALLVMPLSDAELFLGKFLAVMILPAVLASIGLTVFSLGLWLVMGTSASIDFLVLALMLSLVKALAMVAGAVVVSSQTTSVRAANLLASFIILPMALVMQGEVLLVLTGRGHLLWLTFLALLIVAVILLRMGIGVFNREEILARESDQLSLARLRDLVVEFWIRTPREARSAVDPAGPARPWSPRRHLLVDLPELIAIHRGELAVAAGLMIAFAAIGVWLAVQYPIAINPAVRGMGLNQETTFEALSGLSGAAIFRHNFEIVVLTALLATITFGVAPPLILGAPFAIIGFLATQAGLNDVPPPLFLIAFILPHGIAEIPALWLASAFGLNLGLTLIAPPRRLGFGVGLLLAGVEWLKITWLIVPLLALGAVLEVAVTPRVVTAFFGG